MKKMVSVAVYIIKNYNQKKDCQQLTDVRLQNLVFLCDKNYEKKYNKRMFEENYRLTTDGPVIHDLYYIGYPDDIGGKYNTFYRYGDVKLEPDELKIIDEILQRTYDISTEILVRQSTFDFAKEIKEGYDSQFM